MVAKCIMLNSIAKSKMIIPNEPQGKKSGSESVPKLLEIARKNVQELKNLTITKV